MDITDVKDLCSRVGTNTTFLLSATLQVLRNIPEGWHNRNADDEIFHAVNKV